MVVLPNHSSIRGRSVDHSLYGAEGASDLSGDVRLDFPNGFNAAVNDPRHPRHRHLTLIAGPLNQFLTHKCTRGQTVSVGGERAIQNLFEASDFPTAILWSDEMTAIGVDGAPLASLFQPQLTTFEFHSRGWDDWRWKC